MKMKNLTRIGLLVLLIAISLVSCKKEIKEETKLPDGTALKNLIKEKRADKTQEFVVDMSDPFGVDITGEQGTIVKFFPGQLKDKLGNIVTGNIDVTLLEIYSKADMLLMNKSTMGKLPSGDHAMLDSGGEILLKASQNGEELEINGGLTVQFPVDNTGGADTGMELFESCEKCEDDCGDDIICKKDVWAVVDDTTQAGTGGGIMVDTGGVGPVYYSAFVQNFGWTNVDRFYSFAGVKTTLLVDAPTEYDNLNCAIYISYDGEATALGSLDTYIETTELFTEHYGQIPVGLDIHIIAVSIIDGDYYYTIKAVTTAAGATIVLDDLMPTTESALIAEINNLP